jgi:hypothetical protein
VKVKVNQPKSIVDYTLNHPNNTVGFAGKLFQTVVFNAPVLANSVVRITSNKIGIAGCQIQSSLNIDSPNCTELTLSALDLNQQIIIIMANITNNVLYLLIRTESRTQTPWWPCTTPKATSP